MLCMRDWAAWHEAYDDPSSFLNVRLRMVRQRLVEVREADATVMATFADALPADVLLLCGIFGNVSDEDIRFTVEAASAMCRPGGTAIWTRHRRPPDLTPQIRAWFAASGFDELAFDALDTENRLMTVGANRLRRAATGGLPGRP